MKIGICTTDFSRRPLDGLFAAIEGMGFGATQFAFDSIEESGFRADNHIEIPAWIDEALPEKIAECAARHHLELTAVNGTFNMAHPDRAVREEGVRRFDGFARAVRTMGCGMITLCSGTRSRVSLWTGDPANDTPEAWRDMAGCMRAVCAAAEKYDLTLAIETEAGNIISTPERAARIMAEVGSERLKMIMDCANLFHAGEAKRENARAVIGHAFDVFGRDVVLAHGKDIAESDGIRFCAAGEGIVDFPYFIKRLRDANYQGVMMLHGIDREDKMPACRALVESFM